MTTKTSSHYLAPAMLLLGALLAAANWYLDPGRPSAPATALVLLAGLTLALRLARGRPSADTAHRDPGLSITSGIVFAGVIVAVSQGVKLLAKLGAVDRVDLSRRSLMLILAALLVFTGNAIPKTLAPLSAECDAAKAQAVQRLAGWTWVLAGLALAIAWLVLPVSMAEPITFLLLPVSILISAVQLVRLRRTRQTAA